MYIYFHRKIAIQLDICTSRKRHQVDARFFLELSFSTFSPLRRSVTPGVNRSKRQAYGSRWRARAGKIVVARGWQKGVAEVLSSRGIYARYICLHLGETAMHLCMFRGYRMLLANNRRARRSFHGEHTAAIFAA